MNSANAKVYVKFVDGVVVYIPIDAVPVSENIYELLANNEFDHLYYPASVSRAGEVTAS